MKYVLTRAPTLSKFRAGQIDEEFNDLLAIARDCQSYLEVGARHGDSFYRMLRVMPPGAVGVAVDLPGGPWGKTGTETALQAAVAALAPTWNATAILGDSHAQETAEKVKALAPEGGRFDLVFIDGDHSYAGVKRDWDLYGPLGKIVAFHDVNAVHLKQSKFGVPRLWSEIKRSGLRCRDVIAPGSGMGIGIVWMPAGD